MCEIDARVCDYVVGDDVMEGRDGHPSWIVVHADDGDKSRDEDVGGETTEDDELGNFREDALFVR